MDVGRESEDRLLFMFTETVRELEAIRCLRDPRSAAVDGRRCSAEEPGGVEGNGAEGDRGDRGRRGSSDGGEEEEGVAGDEEERRCMQKVLGVLRELGASHSERVTAWREALRRCAHMLANWPLEGSNHHHPVTADKCSPHSESVCNAFVSIQVDIQHITEKLSMIISKLDAEIIKLQAEGASIGSQEMKDANKDEKNHLNVSVPLEVDTGPEVNEEDGDDGDSTMPSSDAQQESDLRSCSSECDGLRGKEEELVSRRQESSMESCFSKDSVEEGGEKVEGKTETNSKWITVGLTGQQTDGGSEVADACFIRAPPSVAEALTCEVADTLSCLMVTGAEELVSRVIRVKVQSGARLRLPVAVVVPFCAQYRGSYRDVAVKMVDEEGRSSYIAPLTTEGAVGGQRGSFAEVRVYSLGLFAVISCLKRESYTVPLKGLSLKLPMDPRVCLNYLPGSFTAPVMAQTMIQPIDAALLVAVKSKSDSYHSVVSTSPVLYLTHPACQPLRRPLTLNFPCPLNPDKKRPRGGHGELMGHQSWPKSTSPPGDQPGKHSRVPVVKSKETSGELLVALGSKDKQWSVLENIAVRNLQNSLVSFELQENFDKLLVVRLLSLLQPCQLASLAEMLEESACRHSVTVLLQRRQDAPHAILVAALPSRDLSWELSRLRGQGYGGHPETSAEICMREGEQLVLRFTGNITSTAGGQTAPGDARLHCITFHSQLRSHLELHLAEVDPFGNHSSPHYKGTAIFYKLTPDQLRGGDGPTRPDVNALGDPVCKLNLTLPKKVRTVSRPAVARVKLCEETDFLSDSLLLWLSEELSEEEVTLLILCLRLRRSAAQLAKLHAGESVSTRAFHVLAMWRRGLPASTPQSRASQLAHSLARSGRPDLARELLLRQAAASKQGPVMQGSPGATTYPALESCPEPKGYKASEVTGL